MTSAPSLRATLASALALALALFCSACDDEKATPDLLDDLDQTEIEIEACPESGAILRTAPILLDLSTEIGQPLTKTLTLNNGGTGQLCFPEQPFTITPEVAGLTIALPAGLSALPPLNPGESLPLTLTYHPTEAVLEDAKLHIAPSNAAPTETTLKVKTGLCINCPSKVLELRCTDEAVPGEAEVYQDTFTVPAVQRLAVSSYHPDGHQSWFFSLRTPEGYNENFASSRWTQARVTTAGRDIIMPSLHTELAAYMIKPGTYTVRGVSKGNSFCYYVIDDSQPAKRLLLTFVFVGLPTLNAITAPNHGDLQVVLRTLQGILDAHGIDYQPAGTRYLDADPDTAALYGVLNNRNDLGPLLATAPYPTGTDRDDLLRLNVFLIRDFADDGVLGLAPLLGFPGGHGTPQGGIAVATTPMLGQGQQQLDPSRPECMNTPTPPSCIISNDGNTTLAYVIAHEAGHFFGLEHTSDHGPVFDNLSDTPECPHYGTSPDPCPDLLNIMYPIAQPGSVQSFSPLQSQRILANPLIQP